MVSTVTVLSRLVWIFIIAALPHAAVSQISDIRGMFEDATRASRNWSEDNATVIDPRLTYDIAAGIRNFSAIYLQASDQSASARSLLSNRAEMEKVVYDFLDQNFSKSNVTHVFELLAKRLGASSTRAGYSKTYFNRYVLVRLPEGWDDARFLLDNYNGTLSSGRFALLGFGSHAVVHGGTTYLLNVVPGSSKRADLTLDAVTSSGVSDGATYWVQPSLDWFCDDANDEFDLGPDRSTILDSELAPFYRADRVRIDLLDSRNICDGNCRSAVSAMVTRAIAQWRSGCSNCGPVSLKAVEFGDELWVDDAFLEALEFGILSNNGLGELKSPGSIVLSRLSFRPRGQMTANGYRRVDDTPYGQALCTEGARRLVGLYLYNRLCGKSVGACSAPECMNFSVGLSRADAQCTLIDGPERIGCGKPDSHIAFNSDYVRFKIGDKQSFGTASCERCSVDAERLVYHEVGHWFRLPHQHDSGVAADGRSEIMLEKPPVRDPVCIRRSTLAQLDYAIIDQWDAKLPQEEAFFAPEDWQ